MGMFGFAAVPGYQHRVTRAYLRQIVVNMRRSRWRARRGRSWAPDSCPLLPGSW